MELVLRLRLGRRWSWARDRVWPLGVGKRINAGDETEHGVEDVPEDRHDLGKG